MSAHLPYAITEMGMLEHLNCNYLGSHLYTSPVMWVESQQGTSTRTTTEQRMWVAFQTRHHCLVQGNKAINKEVKSSGNEVFHNALLLWLFFNKEDLQSVTYVGTMPLLRKSWLPQTDREIKFRMRPAQTLPLGELLRLFDAGSKGTCRSGARRREVDNLAFQMSRRMAALTPFRVWSKIVQTFGPRTTWSRNVGKRSSWWVFCIRGSVVVVNIQFFGVTSIVLWYDEASRCNKIWSVDIVTYVLADSRCIDRQ